MDKLSGVAQKQSEHELRAISFARELIDKYEVFDDFVSNKVLDDSGIDILFIKRVGKKGKHFRFHVQHKPHPNEASAFRKLNPCISTWVVNQQTTFCGAFVSLLSAIIQKALEQESPYAKFFKEKLEEIKNLHESDFKF